MKNNNTVSVSFMLLGILFCVCLVAAKLLQKSEMRKDIVIELSYKGFS